MFTLSPARVKRREFLTQFYAEQWWKERRLPNERHFLFHPHIFRSKLKFETDVTEERIDSNRKFYREKCWQRQTGVVRSMKGILLKIWDKVGLKTWLFSEMTSTVPLPKQHWQLKWCVHHNTLKHIWMMQKQILLVFDEAIQKILEGECNS